MLAQIASRITEYFTSTETKPVQEIAESAATGGPATAVLSGIASGLESSVWAIIAIAGAIGVAIALGGGDIQFSLYLVALTGMGMLATTGVVVSEDTFGPVADNAAGIAEMSGEFEGEAAAHHGEPRRGRATPRRPSRRDSRSVPRSSPRSRCSRRTSRRSRTSSNLNISGNDLFKNPLTAINVANPKTFIGLLIGGSIAFLFSSFAIRAVGRTANVVVQEVRRQFADGLIMKGEKKPDSGAIVDICTEASLRELATPALLAVLSPVIIGFGVNYLALGAFLAAVILTGQLMANFLSNSGGAWDNAKKYIEDGNYGGKNSDAYRAAVIGDTIGDPFKDTAGPALNPLIKVMNLISLLILPAVISLRDNSGRAVQHRGRCARRADRRDPVLEAGRRDAAGRRPDRGDRTRGCGRQLIAQFDVSRRAVLRGGPFSLRRLPGVVLSSGGATDARNRALAPAPPHVRRLRRPRGTARGGVVLEVPVRSGLECGRDRRFLERMAARDEHERFAVQAVVLLETGVLAGWAGLSEPTFLPEILPAIEVGWRLGENFRGHGFATEAGRAWVDYGFGTGEPRRDRQHLPTGEPRIGRGDAATRVQLRTRDRASRPRRRMPRLAAPALRVAGARGRVTRSGTGRLRALVLAVLEVRRDQRQHDDHRDDRIDVLVDVDRACRARSRAGSHRPPRPRRRSRSRSTNLRSGIGRYPRASGRSCARTG